tara:strand:+ start:4666 stop:5148 length:483 start_codon:yes stop_codon:yes gene_type:complete
MVQLLDNMIALIKDELMSNKECKKLISFYKKNKNKADKFRDVFPLALDISKDLDPTLVNKINYLSSTINNSIIDWAQLVYWPKGSKQELHSDNASPLTTLSSICYLNEDFEGGQTYFKEGTVFTPKTGRILFFDGKYYLHGVKKVLSKDRYVLAIWYRNK